MTEKKQLAGAKPDEPSASDYAKLSMLERKFVDLKVSGYLDKGQIIDQLNLTEREYTRLSRRQAVKRIVEWKSWQLEQDALHKQKAIRNQILEKMHVEALERFEPLDEEDLRGLTEKERLMKLATRAENTSFKDFMKTLNDIMKTDREVSVDTGRSEHELVEKVRVQHARRIIVEREEAKTLDGHGLTEDDLFNLTQLDADGNMVVVPFDEVLREAEGGERTSVSRETTEDIRTIEYERRSRDE